MHLRACVGNKISKADLWSAARPNRSHIEVPRVDYEKLSGDRVGEPSECIRARVQAARDIQTKRFSSNASSEIVRNADMRIGEIRQYCKLPEKDQSLRRAAMSQLNLLDHHCMRSLKLAPTIESNLCYAAVMMAFPLTCPVPSYLIA